MRRLAPLLILVLSTTVGGRARAGETACWFENGAVVAPAALGDMSGDFVIDFSAPQTLLHNTKAQAGGFAQTDLTLPVLLAGKRLAPLAVRVVDLDIRGLGFRTPIAGVIGADVLGRYAVSLDFAPCRLRLERTGGRRKAGGWTLSTRDIGGLPTIHATATDGAHAVTGDFAIDTASRAGVRAAAASTDTDPPRRDEAPGLLRALSVDGRLFEHPSAVVTGELPPGVVGAIGTDILAHFRLRLDPIAGRLWLTPKEKGPGVAARP